MGFFKAPDRISEAANFLPPFPGCGSCGLFKTCQSPKMPVSGQGKKKILIVAEAPGATEDSEGIQLVGKSGKYLEDVLDSLNIDMRRDCWLTNSIICRPPKNATPTLEQILHCRPNLKQCVENLKPRTIVPLGGSGVSSLLSVLWDRSPSSQSISKWAGWKIPDQSKNVWVVPTFHPAAILRHQSKKNWAVADGVFRKHLSQLTSIKAEPWRRIPQYESKLKLWTDPEKAARSIRKWREGPVSFDYEGTCLKPETTGAQIVSCAICFGGKVAIAFPWLEPARSATLELLANRKVPKIGANIKFEDRWTRAEGGIVRNWLYDTMLGAHWMSNRTGITSVEFQQYALLGFKPYSGKVKRFLKSRKGSSVNEVLNQIGIMDLLRYNALDALVEYLIARQQIKIMNLGYDL